MLTVLIQILVGQELSFVILSKAKWAQEDWFIMQVMALFFTIYLEKYYCQTNWQNHTF